MGVGAGGDTPSLMGRGGYGGHPQKILKKRTFYAIFKIKFIVISYLVELFNFWWYVRIRAYAWSFFLCGFYRSEHIPDLNCRG